jgi:RHS repeat-associated protein
MAQLYTIEITATANKGNMYLENFAMDVSKNTLTEILPLAGTNSLFERAVGDKRFELSNHLGNVLAVVSDRKLVADPQNFVNFSPDVLSYSDYYPFGMLLPNRHGSTDGYRYGFQGQEKDDEIKGEGNSLNYTFRMYDPRVGRFLSLDPMKDKFPFYSPYSFSGNKVISYKELEGLEELVAILPDDDSAFLRSAGFGDVLRTTIFYASEKLSDYTAKVAVWIAFRRLADGELMSDTGRIFNSNTIISDEAIMDGKNVKYFRGEYRGNRYGRTSNVNQIKQLSNNEWKFASKTLKYISKGGKAFDIIDFAQKVTSNGDLDPNDAMEAGFNYLAPGLGILLAHNKENYYAVGAETGSINLQEYASKGMKETQDLLNYNPNDFYFKNFEIYYVGIDVVKSYFEGNIKNYDDLWKAQGLSEEPADNGFLIERTEDKFFIYNIFIQDDFINNDEP